MQIRRESRNSDIFDNRAFKEARMGQFEGLEVNAGTYNLIIGGVLLWGMLVDFMISYFFGSAINSMNYVLSIILYFVMTIGGTMLVYRSSNPAVSFGGFTLMAAGFGIIISNVVSYYTTSSISMALLITAAVTTSMMLLGMLFPDFFMKIGFVLVWALLAMLVVSVIMALLGVRMEALTYLFIGLFCLYIGYDWAKAQRYPKTLDNAIDSAADIFMDIVNIFIRILRIVGRSRD